MSDIDDKELVEYITSAPIRSLLNQHGWKLVNMRVVGPGVKYTPAQEGYLERIREGYKEEARHLEELRRSFEPKTLSWWSKLTRGNCDK